MESFYQIQHQVGYRRPREVLLSHRPTFKSTVYEELHKSRLSLEYPCSSLDDIEKALAKAFGPDGALLLIQAVRKKLE